ncbi:membrane protein [Microbacterium phage Zooman]|nr:membrane protein [Microbacterium phage Zooman]UDL16589.1 membrane protein [Microbacterium phage Zooman]
MSNHLRDRRHTIIYRAFWTVASIAAFGFLFWAYAQYLAS